jgi:hypothetical protein
MCIRNVIERFLTCFSGLSTSRRSHTMTSLLGMPLELLVQISTYVTTPDLSALRLTCKRLERSLWEWFADEFFAKKQFTYLITRAFQRSSDMSSSVHMCTTILMGHCRPRMQRHATCQYSTQPRPHLASSVLIIVIIVLCYHSHLSQLHAICCGSGVLHETWCTPRDVDRSF